MKIDLYDALDRALYAFVGASVFFVAQMAAQDPVEPKITTRPPAYLPSDLGEKSVLWLEENDGELNLKYEKHVQVSANKHALKDAGQIHVPVSVD